MELNRDYKGDADTMKKILVVVVILVMYGCCAPYQKITKPIIEERNDSLFITTQTQVIKIQLGATLPSPAEGVPITLFSLFGQNMGELDPITEDGLRYMDYLYVTAISSEFGVLKFKMYEGIDYLIYSRNDTLFIEIPGGMIIEPGMTIDEPFTYTVWTYKEDMTLLDMAANEFYSVYRFPTDVEGVYRWVIVRGVYPQINGPSQSADTLGFVPLLGYDTETQRNMILELQKPGRKIVCGDGGVYIIKEED